MLWGFSIFHREDCPVLTGMLDFKISSSTDSCKLVQPFTAFSSQAKAMLLQVPLQCSQVDLNQLVIWILHEWQSILGGIWSRSANKDINVFKLQQLTLVVKDLYFYDTYHTIIYPMIYIAYHHISHDIYHVIYHSIYNCIYHGIYLDMYCSII
jgi:hypothetical protein